MARTGTTIENPVTKERFTFLATAQDTEGELLRVDLTVAPGGGIRMRHVHPRQEERWEITEGRARFRLGREEVLAGPGETVVAPPGTPHAFVNAEDEDLSTIVELRPALRAEELFETIAVLAAGGALDDEGRPPPLLAMAIGREFREEAVLPYVPLAVQRALLTAAAPFVRLAGHDDRLLHTAP